MSLCPHPMPDLFSSPTHIRRKSAKDSKSKPTTHSDSTHLETELQTLRKHLRPIPFVPKRTLDFAHHETLLRSLGLWDFLHLEFEGHIRTDLLEQLIATYDPKRHHVCRSRVNGFPIRLARAHLARALKLEVKRSRKNSNEAVDCESKVVSDDEVLFVEAFVSNWLVLLDDNCASPAEVSKFFKFIKERKLHMVDWAGLVWLMVERELSKGPELIHCHYASHLQLLLKFQRPRLFEGAFVNVIVNPSGLKMWGSDDFEGQDSKSLQISDGLGHRGYGMKPKVEEVVNDSKIGDSDSCCGVAAEQRKSDADPKQEEVLKDVRFGGHVDFCPMELENNQVELNSVQGLNENKSQTENSVKKKEDVVDENLGGSADFHKLPCLKLEPAKIENETVGEAKEDDIMDLEECKEKERENNLTELSLELGNNEKEPRMDDSVEEEEDAVDLSLGGLEDFQMVQLENNGTFLKLEQGKIEKECVVEVKKDIVDLVCRERDEANGMELSLVQGKNQKEPMMEDSVEQKEDMIDENLGDSEDFPRMDLETNGTYLDLQLEKIGNQYMEEIGDFIDSEEWKEKERENNKTKLSLVQGKDEKELNTEDSVEENEDVLDENLGGSKDLERAELESNGTCLNAEQGKIENEIMEEVKEHDVSDLGESKDKQGKNSQMQITLVQEKNEMELNMEEFMEKKEDGVDENLGISKDFHMAELEDTRIYLNLERGRIENENMEEIKEDNVIDLEDCQENEGENNEMELNAVQGNNEKEGNMEDTMEDKEDMVDENLGGPKDFHSTELENNRTYLILEQGKIENENVEESKEDGVIYLEECWEKEGENGQMEVSLVQDKNGMDLNREESVEEKKGMFDENLGHSEDFYMVELENNGTCLNLEQGKIEHESVEQVKEDDVIDLEGCQEKGQLWFDRKKDIRGLFLQHCSLNQFGELKLHSDRKEIREEQSDELFLEQPPRDTLSLPHLVQSMGSKDPSNFLPVPTYIVNDSYQESTSRMNTLLRMDDSSIYGNPLKRKSDHENDFSMEIWESKLDTNMNLGGPSAFDNSLKTERACHNVQACSLNASQKRMKIDDPWEEKSMDFSFCMEQIASWMAKAKITFAERERACISAQMNQRMLVNEIKQRDNIIQLCKKTKHEELQKRERVIRRLERDVCFMENLLGDYRRALKETRKTFAKYRRRCPLPEMPLYRDAAGSGGVVLSVTELGKQSPEPHRSYEIKLSMIEDTIREFQLKWVGRLEAHLVKVFSLNERLQVVEEEAKLLKEACLKALNF